MKVSEEAKRLFKVLTKDSLRVIKLFQHIGKNEVFFTLLIQNTLDQLGITELEDRRPAERTYFLDKLIELNRYFIHEFHENLAILEKAKPEPEPEWELDCDGLPIVGMVKGKCYSLEENVTLSVNHIRNKYREQLEALGYINTG